MEYRLLPTILGMQINMGVKEQGTPNGIHGHAIIDRLGLAKLRSPRIGGLMNLIGRRQMKNHMDFYPVEIAESILRKQLLIRDTYAKFKMPDAGWNKGDFLDYRLPAYILLKLRIGQ